MKETALKIRLYGDSLLRKRAKPIEKPTQYHRDILSKMAQLMYQSQGIGLAATQVGINEAMLVADVGSGLYKLLNSKIIKKEGQQKIEEGCLSVPGVCIKVKRAKRILLRAEDEFGKPISLEAEDLLACVFQHEIDHLNGRMIVDYTSFFEKLKIRKKLKEIKQTASTSLEHIDSKYPE